MCKILIEKVGNGYILKGNFENGDIRKVIEIPRKKDGKFEAMKNLLDEVLSYYRFYSFKEDLIKIEVKVKKVKVKNQEEKGMIS